MRRRDITRSIGLLLGGSLLCASLAHGDSLDVQAAKVFRKITETDPGLKGDTAQGGTKPATLETGAVVKVPLFIEIGEVVKVDTRTGEYMSRVKK